MITTTVTDALSGLKEEGYVLNFNLKPDCVECKALKLQLSPANFVIVKFYRFEGERAILMTVLLFMQYQKDGLKGALVNAYGIYADSLANEMMKKLKIMR